MHELLNHMKRQAQGVLGNLDNVRIGTVSGYKPDEYMVKVQLSDGAETGFIPLQTAWAGNQWGMFCPPHAGATVLVVPIDGSLDAAYAVPALFFLDDRPLAVDQGEFWLVHKSGSLLKFLNSGDIEMVAKNTLNFTGDVNITGNLHASGNVSDGTRSMAADRNIYNNHTQPVSNGVAQKPTQQE